MSGLIKTDLSLFQDRVADIAGDTPHSDVKKAINEIKNEMHRTKDIVALCGPQLGFNLRLFVVRTAENQYKEFLNPMVVSKSKDVHLSFETNPSLPDKNFIITRYNEIHVAYQTHDGHIQSESYKGVYAEVVQQMIEMLDGITLMDYGFDLDDVGGLEEFNKASKKDKQTVIQMYLENLKQTSKAMAEEIESNPETKELNDLINFNTKMLSGEIKPVDADGNIVEPLPPKTEDTEEVS